MDTKSRRFWPRLFGSARRKTAATEAAEETSYGYAGDDGQGGGWEPRAYANSSVSAATAVGGMADDGSAEYAAVGADGGMAAVTPDGTLSAHRAPLLLRALPLARADAGEEKAGAAAAVDDGIRRGEEAPKRTPLRATKLRRRKPNTSSSNKEREEEDVGAQKRTIASAPGGELFPEPLLHADDIVAKVTTLAFSRPLSPPPPPPPAHARRATYRGDSDVRRQNTAGAGSARDRSATTYSARGHMTAGGGEPAGAANSKPTRSAISRNGGSSSSSASGCATEDATAGADDDGESCAADGAGAFWSTYDRAISQGGDTAATAAAPSSSRTIIDAMVDDIASVSGGIAGWQVAEGRGTFNDALSSVGAIHPIVLAFARAHAEHAVVCLGAEHVWLAILQGVAAMVRRCGSSSSTADSSSSSTTSSSADDIDSGDVVDLERLWSVLRRASPIPTSVVAATGHEIRLFPADAYARHLVYAGRGAAPVAMAAAAAAAAPATRDGAVQSGHICVGGRRVAWQPRRRSTNPAWVQTLRREGGGVRGLCLAGSLQGWSGLCVLARQLKETYAGRARTFDWWLHRVHLLCSDLADYYAAQDEFAESGVPAAWQRWFSTALFDGHSGAPRGERMDGWLSALFAVDAFGEPVHSKERWAMDWEAVPSGVDLLHLPRGALNLYSGFVGVQELRRDSSTPSSSASPSSAKTDPAAFPLRTRDQSATLRSEDDVDTAAASAVSDFDAAGASIRDRSSTLRNSLHDLPASVPQEGAGSKKRSASMAVAPVIGWALDK
ncbi:hypothetical protein GGI11_000247 [Coemansia sp. RSA 2049]|nr:hypothetical protein GGI11_000247 [Coemansia sp. RSA 2049]